jgi:hypothetical protein
MRVTIIPIESRVNVEGYSETIDCSAVDEEIHVIQWYGNFGEVEYETDVETGKRKPNERIDSFEPYQSLLAAWEIEAQKKLDTAGHTHAS